MKRIMRYNERGGRVGLACMAHAHGRHVMLGAGHGHVLAGHRGAGAGAGASLVRACNLRSSIRVQCPILHHAPISFTQQTGWHTVLLYKPTPSREVLF